VLLGQSYRTPHGAVTDEYGATVEWYTDRGKQKNSEKKLSQCQSKGLFTLNDTTEKHCYRYFKWARSHSTTETRQRHDTVMTGTTDKL
jgi:hypothetical protein